MRDYVPSALFDDTQSANATGGLIDNGRRLLGSPMGDGGDGFEDLYGGAGRILRATASGGASTSYGSGLRVSVYIILQAITSLLSILRLVFYFKGVLRLGALVHTMVRIIRDILPLNLLIAVLTLAFWSAIYLLMSVELTEEGSPEWHTFFGSVSLMVNMGLYSDIDKKVANFERSAFAQLLFHMYMLIVQLILLNMLIAIMGESNAAVRQVSQLVAQFERAQLILKWEERLAASLRVRRPDSRFHRFERLVSGFPVDCSKEVVESLFPSWIHVLMPPKRGLQSDGDSGGGGGGGGGGGDGGGGAADGVPRPPRGSRADADERAEAASKRMSAQIDRLERNVQKNQEESRRMVQSLVEMVEHGTQRHGQGGGNGLSEHKSTVGGGSSAAQASKVTQQREPPESSGTGKGGFAGWLGLDHLLSMRNGASDLALETATQKVTAQLAIAPVPPEDTATVAPPKPAIKQDHNGGGAPSRASVKIETLVSAEIPRRKTQGGAFGALSGGRATHATKGAKRGERITDEPPTPGTGQPLPAPVLAMKQPPPPPSQQRAGVPMPVSIQAPPRDPRDPSKVLRHVRDAALEGAPAAGVDAARAIARQMREPSYSLRQYHDDLCAAFVELRYYRIAGSALEVPAAAATRAAAMAAATRGGLKRQDSQSMKATSGVQTSAEYLRTLGAFFAIYWLARIGIDGEDGFSFGVDEAAASWPPRKTAVTETSRSGASTPTASSSFLARRFQKVAQAAAGAEVAHDPNALFFAQSASERATAFRKGTSWDELHKLMLASGLLTQQRADPAAVVKDSTESMEGKEGKEGTEGEPPLPSAGAPSVVVNVDRMAAMLAFTAVHDIMKMEQLLPVVQAAHAPYEGFGAGVTINDHDVALGYILEHFEASLPSISMLSSSLQATIRFCTVKLGFNHGWCVELELARFSLALSA